MQLIKYILNFFWKLHKPFVKKNKIFKNKHLGETCFIFGNGGSLKYYDIDKLPDNPSIVCAHSLIDNRLKKMNIKYLAITDSYILYPFLFNTSPQIRKIQTNKIKKIFWDSVRGYNKGITIFTSLTNIYASFFKRLNINFFHHFEMKESNSCDLSGDFSTCHGALDVMLGMAQYMGFSKAIVMGCDYLGTPIMQGHFYADGRHKPHYSSKHHEEGYSNYRQRVKAVGKDIETLVILPEGVTSPDFNYDSYENYFGLEKNYRDNFDFIDQKYIELLREAAESNQAVMREHV
jgi:hypothetical protein